MDTCHRDVKLRLRNMKLATFLTHGCLHQLALHLLVFQIIRSYSDEDGSHTLSYLSKYDKIREFRRFSYATCLQTPRVVYL